MWQRTVTCVLMQAETGPEWLLSSTKAFWTTGLWALLAGGPVLCLILPGSDFSAEGCGLL